MGYSLIRTHGGPFPSVSRVHAVPPPDVFLLTESFNKANSTIIGPDLDWISLLTVPSNFPNTPVVYNNTFSISPDEPLNGLQALTFAAAMTVDVFPDTTDGFVQVEIASIDDGAVLMFGTNFHTFVVESNAGTFPNDWRLYGQDAPAMPGGLGGGLILANGTLASPLVPGDVLRMEISPNELRMYINTILLDSVTTTTFLGGTHGLVQAEFRAFEFAYDPIAARLDNFKMGEIV